jgi:hypothetical protein
MSAARAPLNLRTIGVFLFNQTTHRMLVQQDSAVGRALCPTSKARIHGEGGDSYTAGNNVGRADVTSTNFPRCWAAKFRTTEFPVPVLIACPFAGEEDHKSNSPQNQQSCTRQNNQTGESGECLLSAPPLPLRACYCETTRLERDLTLGDAGVVIFPPSQSSTIPLECPAMPVYPLYV